MGTLHLIVVFQYLYTSNRLYPNREYRFRNLSLTAQIAPHSPPLPVGLAHASFLARSSPPPFS